MSWGGFIGLWIAVIVMVGLVLLDARNQYKEAQKAEGDGKE